jgi:hypothetical protein
VPLRYSAPVKPPLSARWAPLSSLPEARFHQRLRVAEGASRRYERIASLPLEFVGDASGITVFLDGKPTVVACSLEHRGVGWDFAAENEGI